MATSIPAAGDEQIVPDTATSSSADGLRSLPRSKPIRPRHFENCFPAKLYQLLENVESLGLSAVVSWQTSGRAFVVKDRSRFLAQLVPLICRATKYRSFQRQCGLWGFQR